MLNIRSAMMPRQPTSRPRALSELEVARRAVLVRRPLHWQVAEKLIAALEAAWSELDRRAANEASKPDDATTHTHV